MKMSPKFIILLTLFVAVGFALEFAEAEDATSDENLYVLHEDLSKITMKDCVGCHDVLSEKSLDRDIRTAHVIHAFFGKDGCLHCHQDFDINQDSGHILRRQVDMNICLNCHVSTEKEWKASMSPAQQ